VRGKPFVRARALAGVLALGLIASAAATEPVPPGLVAAGQRLYSEGRDLSGQPLRATVQGDVPLLGTHVTCRSCHGRSGMGTIEGGRIPAPLAGPLLFAPNEQRRRPAYTADTLARALRDGIDPAGRPIDPLMPRYQLGGRDLEALVAFLRQLGAARSPGVAPGHLRIATVIAGSVDREIERASLEAMQAYVDARNRSGPQRLRGGHFPRQWKEEYFEWTLDVWRLSGPSASWRAQLEARYREQPVFALVGGLASGAWQPIHDFCEATQMPCLLPDTDLPPAGNEGFYSLYYSRGLRLEAQIMAAALAADGRQRDVLAVIEGDAGSPSAEAAESLTQALEARGGRVRTLDARSERGAIERALAEPASAIVLWLSAQSVRRLAAPLAASGATTPLMLSSTMLGARWDDLPAGARARAKVVHLTALPGERDSALARFRAWSRARGLQLHEERHQALAYFAMLTFAEGTKHTTIYLSRDYLLDLLEHAATLTAYLPLYRRAGMTPGQRVLSRGGYLVDLAAGGTAIWQVP